MQTSVHKKLSAGFAMLEVLIAAFVLCFGILALAAVQVKTFSLTRDASLRSDIALQAESLAESMRANPMRIQPNAQGIMKLSLQSYNEPSAVSGNAVAPSVTCENANNCTQAQLAKYDLFLFHKHLHEVFPSDSDVVSQVCYTSNSANPTLSDMGCNGAIPPNGKLTIKIAWRSKATLKESRAVSTANATATDRFINSGYVLRVEQ